MCLMSHLVAPEHGGHGAVRVPHRPVLGEAPQPHLPGPRVVSLIGSLQKIKSIELYYDSQIVFAKHN